MCDSNNHWTLRSDDARANLEFIIKKADQDQVQHIRYVEEDGNIRDVFVISKTQLLAYTRSSDTESLELTSHNDNTKTI